MYNHEPVVVAERLRRTADVVLIVPTCRSAEVTLATIRRCFELNSSTDFDVLLVDNGASDYREIDAAVGPERLSYVALERNVGTAGAQEIGQRKALELGYETLILGENDAVLLTEDGFAALLRKLRAHEPCAVLPHNVARGAAQGDNDHHVALPHFLAISRQTLERVGPFDARYFMQGEDMEYTARLRASGVRLFRTGDCLYYHPIAKPGLFSNRVVYHVLRSRLIFIYRNPLRSAPRRRTLALLRLVLPYIAVRLLRALRDPSVLTTMLLAVRDFRAERLSETLPRERFAYAPVEGDGAGACWHDIESPRAPLLPLKRYFLDDPVSGRRQMFERVRAT